MRVVTSIGLLQNKIQALITINERHTASVPVVGRRGFVGGWAAPLVWAENRKILNIICTYIHVHVYNYMYLHVNMYML